MAAAAHSSFYSYDNVEYKNSNTKVLITCPVHGDFSQTPHDHLSGSGCPKCKVGADTFGREWFYEELGKGNGCIEQTNQE